MLKIFHDRYHKQRIESLIERQGLDYDKRNTCKMDIFVISLSLITSAGKFYFTVSLLIIISSSKFSNTNTEAIMHLKTCDMSNQLPGEFVCFYSSHSSYFKGKSGC